MTSYGIISVNPTNPFSNIMNSVSYTTQWVVLVQPTYRKDNSTSSFFFCRLLNKVVQEYQFWSFATVGQGMCEQVVLRVD